MTSFVSLKKNYFPLKFYLRKDNCSVRGCKLKIKKQYNFPALGHVIR